jgi:hypothetical protein
MLPLFYKGVLIDVGIVPPAPPHAVIDPSALREAKAYKFE